MLGMELKQFKRDRIKLAALLGMKLKRGSVHHTHRLLARGIRKVYAMNPETRALSRDQFTFTDNQFVWMEALLAIAGHHACEVDKVSIHLREGRVLLKRAMRAVEKRMATNGGRVFK